jgi:hypothetical protein
MGRRVEAIMAKRRAGQGGAGRRPGPYWTVGRVLLLLGIVAAIVAVVAVLGVLLMLALVW